jgi:hypothetical protein
MIYQSILEQHGYVAAEEMLLQEDENLLLEEQAQMDEGWED